MNYDDPFDDGCYHAQGETDDQGCTFLGYKPARTHIDELKRLLAEHGLTLDITWRWNKRNRDGVLTLSDGQRPVFTHQFSRNTALWKRGDEQLERVHTGSPRHQAVLAALTYLHA